MTGLEFKGELLGHEIFRATRFELLPVNPDVEPELYPAENYLTGLLRKHLEEGMFWFSYTWDLTRRLQAQWNDSGDGKYLWEVVSIQNSFRRVHLLTESRRMIGSFGTSKRLHNFKELVY